jgi:hypothetical protein
MEPTFTSHSEHVVLEDTTGTDSIFVDIETIKQYDVAFLVARLNSNESDKAKQAAACALCNLSFYTDASSAIVHAGAIRPLVTLLSTGGTSALKEVAVIALWSIARNYSHAATIVQMDAIGPLVALLNASQSDTLTNAAAELLHTLAMNNHVCAIVQAGAIAPVVTMLGNDARKEMAAELLETIAEFGYSYAIRKAHVHRHWAIARAFVHLHTYAFFWYAHVGQKLCALGGNWRISDRIAFEEDFDKPHQ